MPSLNINTNHVVLTVVIVPELLSLWSEAHGKLHIVPIKWKSKCKSVCVSISWSMTVCTDWIVAWAPVVMGPSDHNLLLIGEVEHSDNTMQGSCLTFDTLQADLLLAYARVEVRLVAWLRKFELSGSGFLLRAICRMVRSSFGGLWARGWSTDVWFPQVTAVRNNFSFSFKRVCCCEFSDALQW